MTVLAEGGKSLMGEGKCSLAVLHDTCSQNLSPFLFACCAYAYTLQDCYALAVCRLGREVCR